MTDLKRWAQLKNIAFGKDKFVDVEIIKKRLGYEYHEFIRLNYIVMEMVHYIHNENMLSR
jgi:hypothetical protein